jgi:hypothetical protein
MNAEERDGLRAMVREVIREALAARAGTGATPATGADIVEPVRIASDADLDAFVRRLVRLMRDPAGAARIDAGAHRFTLERGAAVSAVTAPCSGLVNEKAVDALQEGAVLRLAPDAVVTPLARDRARQRRIKFERVRRC